MIRFLTYANIALQCWCFVMWILCQSAGTALILASLFSALGMGYGLSYLKREEYDATL